MVCNVKKIVLLGLALCSPLIVLGQLLWRIDGNGLKSPSYVFGTYHVSSASFLDSIPKIRIAMDSTLRVCGEVDMAEMQSGDFLAKSMEAMLFQGDTTLSSLLGAERSAKVSKLTKKYIGADLSNPALNKLKPYALMVQIELAMAASVTPGAGIGMQLDEYFQKRAIGEGKECVGFETPDFQLALLSGATIGRQVELLMCLADNSDFQYQMLSDIVDAYLNRDFKALEKSVDEKMGNSCDATVAEENAMLYARNSDWVGQMPGLMAGMPTLFVVGAAHLLGRKGLLQLLRDKGYRVKPIDNN